MLRAQEEQPGGAAEAKREAEPRAVRQDAGGSLADAGASRETSDAAADTLMDRTLVRIAVDRGRFPSVSAAANAEREIDWWDERNADAAVCTACFAAEELAAHLNRIARPAGEGPLAVVVSPDEAAEVDAGVTIWVGALPAAGHPARDAWDGFEAREADAWRALPDEGYAVRTALRGAALHYALVGKGRSGTLYAAYALLEAFGFRWLALGRQGTAVPAAFAPQPVSLLDYPRFKTRGVYSEHIRDNNSELIDWLGRRRINFAALDRIDNPHALKKRGIRLCAGGHNILYRFLNPHDEYPYRHAVWGGEDKPDDPYPLSPEYAGKEDEGPLTYAEAHPEWFGWIRGKRSFDVGQGDREGYGDNYCTTNEDATRELCARLTEDLISGEWRHVDYINFWMLDNGAWCECERCAAAGNYAYKLILIVHTLRTHLRQARETGRLKRDVKILFPIYHETLPAPDRPLPDDYDYESCFPTYFPIERCYTHRLNDPACTETNQELMDTFVPWTTAEERHYRGETFIGEYYNVGAFAACPVPFMTIMKDDIPFYYNSGIRHFHYMHLTDDRWGTLALTNYQLYSMLWNPALDTEALLAEYYALSYGAASETMRQFYETLEAAMRNAKYLKHYQYHRGVRHALHAYLREGAAELFPLKHMQYDVRLPDGNAGISLTETMGLLAACRRLLDKALMTPVGEQAAARLLEDDFRFRYLEDMAGYLYYMVRTHLLAQRGDEALSRRAFRYAARHAEALRRNTEAVRPTSRFDLYDNGLKASWCEQAYVRYKERYGADEEEELRSSGLWT